MSTHVWNAAFYASGEDASLRTRLADVLRPKLADAIERFRKKVIADPDLEDNELDDESSDTDDEGGPDESSDLVEELVDNSNEPASKISQRLEKENELDRKPEIFYLIKYLTALADPKSYDLIMRAIDE